MHRVGVVIVTRDDRVDVAMLSAGMIRKWSQAGKILAVTSPTISSTSESKLATIFDEIVKPLDDDGRGEERDRLLLHCLSLSHFEKLMIVDGGVVIRGHLIDGFEHDSLIPDLNGNWKIAFITPNKTSYERAMKFKNRITTLEEMKSALQIKSGGTCSETHVVLPLNGLKYCSTKDAPLFIEVNEGMLAQSPSADGKTNVSELEEELASMLATMRKLPIPTKQSLHKDWIAIVGMSCRFPEANSVEEYWDVLKPGRSTSEFPSEYRVALSNLDTKFKLNLLKCDVDQFDANFFGMSPAETIFTDPQGRLLLELSWEAFEDAGLQPEKLRDSPVGIFFGTWLQEYKEMMNREGKSDEEFLRKYLGNGVGSVSAKLSYFYGFTGPNIATESGCSSSIVAVDLACKSLQRGECPLAIAAGANIILQMDTKNKLVWAADGKCKTFDKDGDGYGRGEGVAVLVLKRYSDALKNGDRIHGVILGSGASQEGLSRSYGSPTVASEMMAMKNAFKAAHILPTEVDYVEAHATGTEVGDPIEAAAIVQAYSCSERERRSPLLIGSGKTNIGHTESCSGIAAIIKVLLAMKYELIPPHVNLQQLNPKVDFAPIPGSIPLQPVEWKRTSRPRIAGISNFGITGTDVHMIIKEGPVSTQKGFKTCLQLPSINIITISAKNEDAMSQLVALYTEHLQKLHEDCDMFSIAYTANACRSHHPVRRAVVGRTLAEIVASLHEVFIKPTLPSRTALKICVVFTSSYELMTDDELINFGVLYDSSPPFKTYMDFCNLICQQAVSPRTPPVTLLRNQGKKKDDRCRVSSLSCKFSCYFSLFKLWQTWGVKPEEVLGHGFGELVARAVKRDCTLEDTFDEIKNIAAALSTENEKLRAVPKVTDSNNRENLDVTMVTAETLGCNTVIHIGFCQELNRLPDVSEMSLKDTERCWLPLVSTLVSLYEAGYDVDWEGFYKPYSDSRIKVDLPHYPFQRKRFWYEPKPAGTMEVGFNPGGKKLHPFLGTSLPNASSLHIFQNRFANDKEIGYINDHVIGNQAIFPGAGYLEMALAACSLQAEAKNELVFLTDFKIHTPLQFTNAEVKNAAIQTLHSPPKDGQPGNISINMQLGSDNDHQWKLYASTDVDMASDFSHRVGQNLSETVERIKRQFVVGDPETLVQNFYENLAKVGLNYGPHFKPIRKIWRDETQTLVEVIVSSTLEGNYKIYPTLLDAMLQCFILQVYPEISALHVPVKIKHFVCSLLAAAKLQNLTTTYILSDSEGASLLDNSSSVIALMVNPELRKTTVNTVLKAAATARNQPIDDINGYEVMWKPSTKLQVNTSLQLSISESYTDSTSFHSLLTHIESRNKFSTREKQLDEKMDELCNLYVLKSFYEMGWKPESQTKFEIHNLASQLHIVKPLVPAFRHFFGYLEKVGFFEKVEGNRFILKNIPMPEAQIDSCIVELLLSRALENYAAVSVVKVCGANLAGVLQGKSTGQTILFGTEDRNGLNLAEFYYQNNRFYKDGAKAPAKVFGQLVTNMWDTDGGVAKKLRVLEIGAGTGAFTTDALRLLEENGVEFEYVFTDISSAFFSRAELKFQNYFENITFKKLDIEKDPLEQGFLPAYFDVVVAVDVLHATKVLRNTLKRVEMLTKLGGSLIIGETNKPIKEVDIVFGLVDGYWKYEDISLRPSHCTVTADQWEILYKTSGYSGRVQKIYASDSNMCTVMGKLCQRPTQRTIPAKHTWLLFHATEKTRGDKFYQNFIERLNSIGREVVELSPKSFEEKWETLANENLNLDGVIYLIENVASLEPKSCKLLLEPLLKMSQHFLRQSGLPKLVVATVGLSWAEFDGGEKCSPAAATVWGFVRSARMEMVGTVSKLIDLDPTSDADTRSAQLLQEIWAGDDEETEIMYRSSTRLVRRLKRSETSATALTIPPPSEGGYSIALPDSKLLTDLKYVQKNSEDVLSDNEVLVDIRSSSLNFKDVLCVMKPTAEFERINAIGMDFSGVIRSLGQRAEGWKVGDRVFGYSAVGGTIANNLKVKSHVLAKIPHRLTFAEAATLPVAFITAWYCISNVAQMKAGQTILIHAASGGVGLIAIQISKHFGLKVIGTAGSSKKRNYLKSLGVPVVLNSRTLEYGQKICELTGGKGVDMVLNCLTGPGFKEASLSICKEGAWFVEISKLDIWTPTEFSALKPSVNYRIVDAQVLQPDMLKDIMNTLTQFLDKRVVEPIPFISYSASRVIDAMTLLQKAKHIGKIIVEMPLYDVEKCYYDNLFNSQSTYLITGGKGAIGFAIAKWMVSAGAKYIVLLGRSPPKPEMEAEILTLNEGGAVIISMEADVSNFKECERVFKNIEQDPTLPQLRGIHHCSGVLSDRMVVNQSWDNFEYVMSPKVDGAFNLHKLAEGLPLEFFVLHSSSTCTFGNVGQSNYSVANAYMESLVEMRHWNGLKGMAISWGHWNAGLAEDKEVEGYSPMSVEEGIAALELCFVEKWVAPVVGKLNVNQICKLVPSYTDTFLEELTTSQNDDSSLHKGDKTFRHENIEEDFKNTEGVEAKQVLVKMFVGDLVCETLGVQRTEFDDDTLFGDMGMDSLLSIEFLNKVQYRLKHTKLGFVDMVESGTVTKISEIIFNALNTSSI